MSSSQAELTLIMKAQNLASSAISTLREDIGTIKAKAIDAAEGWVSAFGKLGSRIGSGLGNVITNIAQGQDVQSAFMNAGAMGAGFLVEQLTIKLLEKLAATAFVQGIAATLSAAGASIGGVIAAAIPIGMAAAPFLILAAIVAAIAFLITHPEVLRTIAEVAGSIVHHLIAGLAGLAGMILGAIVAAPGAIANVVGGFVTSIVGFFLALPGRLVSLGGEIVSTIIGGLVSLPGKLANAVHDAFMNLDIDAGIFHIHGGHLRIDFGGLAGMSEDDIRKLLHANGAPGYASGGWAGLHGPELAWLGEKGPEYVVPNHQLGGSSSSSDGVRILGFTEAQILDMIDRGLFFRLQRAGTSVHG